MEDAASEVGSVFCELRGLDAESNANPENLEGVACGESKGGDRCFPDRISPVPKPLLHILAMRQREPFPRSRLPHRHVGVGIRG